MDENYISLERAIERMYEVTEECGTERIFIDRIIDELENLPSSPNICIHPQWIPVSERLPEQGQEVIIYTGNILKPTVMAYQFWNPKYDTWTHVTHWMPLPNPPQEDN